MTIEPSPEGPIFASRDDIEPVIVEAPPTLRTGGIVAKAKTPMTEREIATALDLGHVGAFNSSASVARLSVAWAMVCQETGRGTALWGWNIGNVDAAQGWTGDRFSLTANEGSGASTHAQTKYLRAYAGAYAGAVGWWRYLAEHHATALAAFDSGDGDAVGMALKKSGYFTGDVTVYCRALRLMAAEFLQKSGSL